MAIDNEIVSKEYYYFCNLVEDQCGDTSGKAPLCFYCEIRKEWKASNKSIEAFWEEKLKEEGN